MNVSATPLNMQPLPFSKLKEYNRHTIWNIPQSIVCSTLSMVVPTIPNVIPHGDTCWWASSQALGWSTFPKFWVVMHEHKDNVRHASYWNSNIIQFGEEVHLLHTKSQIFMRLYFERCRSYATYSVFQETMHHQSAKHLLGCTCDSTMK